MKKEIFLTLFDGLCSVVWSAFIFLNWIAGFTLFLAGKIILGIWLVLSIVWPLSKIAPWVNNLSKKSHSTLNPTFKRLRIHYENFLSRTAKSLVLKRIFVPILIILLFLAVYPPSHWGYWKLREQGIASYYGYGFYFRKTASGERYWPWSFSAASLTLPLGTVAKVVNKYNGQSVYVTINDRGPYVTGRILDLSFASALKLGMIREGLVPVDIYTKQ